MNKANIELKKFISLQLVDYVEEQTSNRYVSSELKKKTRSGIENICISALGTEYTKTIKGESSKILRACLNDNQMGITTKVLKFFDSRKTGNTGIISNIINEIVGSNASTENKNEQKMIQKSWSERLRAESSQKNLEKA